MSRSSIFSFESLEGFRPSLPKGLLAAATVVLCLELSVRLIPEKYLVTFYSRLGFGIYMENEILPKFPNPQIAIFGTSRAADAFMPRMIDETLGLPKNSTVNVGLFGSRTSDWEALYRRNRDRLKHCKLVILNVDEWSFSSGVGSDEHFALTAPLSDRLSFVRPTEAVPVRDGLRWNDLNLPAEQPNPPGEKPADKEKRIAAKMEYMTAKRNRLLADWAFNLRLKLGYAPAAFAKAAGLGSKRNPPFDSNNMIRSNTVESGGEILRAENYDDRINNFYKFFDTHPIYERHVEDLARMVHEDGGTFVLMHLPNRRTYQQEVEKLHPLEYEQHIRKSRELADHIGAKFYSFRYPEEMGLTDRDYEDYCHLAWNGTMVATRWLINRIQEDKLLK